MKYVVLAALLGLILRGMESKAQAKVFSSGAENQCFTAVGKRF